MASTPQRNPRRENHVIEQEQQELSADELLMDADSDILPTLSVVMPTLDEEEGISTCMEWIRNAIVELQMPAEVIVSDSSTDRTPEIAREYGAIVVEPDQPGYGYAYRYAFERARGVYLVMGDADTTYDFEEIPRLLDYLRETGADMVMGSRLEGKIEPGAMPTLHQYVGNPLLTQFLNAFYRAGVSDAHSGFRVFTREALETMQLETDGMEFASEMIMEAGARDLTIEELPIVYQEREGEETLDSFRDGWRHVRFMLLNAPGYLFSVPGIMLGLFGVAIMTMTVTGVPGSSVTLGLNSMIAGALCVILGYQVAGFSVFATIASDPIRKPSDPVTNWLVERLSLERGVLSGVVLAGFGAGYAIVMVWLWVSSGFAAVPFSLNSLVAFTMIVLGVQTVFSSFFMSTVAGN